MMITTISHDLGVMGLKLLYALIAGIIFVSSIVVATICEERTKKNEKDRIKNNQE